MERESEKRDIYPAGKYSIDRHNELVKEAQISALNKELIFKFQNYLYSKGSGDNRVCKVTWTIRELAVMAGKDLNTLTKQDCLDLVVKINRNTNHEESTKADYRRVLKQFFKWYKDDDKRLESSNSDEKEAAKRMYNYLEKEVKMAYKKKQIDPTSILSEEDIELVITKGCKITRDIAFIKFLYETGVRIGEMLNLKIKDIEIKQHLGVAYVNGKTGRRSVQFTRSMKYITQWLELHPLRDNPESYLWVTSALNYPTMPVGYSCAVKLLDMAFERAGLAAKRHNPHWFRHSRATLLAPHVSESILCKYMGWVQSSEQVDTYVHLCQSQVEDAILRVNGLADMQQEKKNLPLKCGCGAVNDYSARFCFKCGNPLSIIEALNGQTIYDKELNETLKEFLNIAQNPEMLKAFMEFKKRESL